VKPLGWLSDPYVSRLDSFIRRLEAQRACLNHAAHLVRNLNGAVLELGLGNGRTYDHLRVLFPDRKIYVCERQVAAHPDCVPPSELLLLGDMRETLRDFCDQLGGRIALAHLDPATGDVVASEALAVELAPLIPPLLRLGGVLVSEPALVTDGLVALPLPAEVEPGRYNLYRRVSYRSPP
jgi:S-adenosyl-L-methionine methyltransferase